RRPALHAAVSVDPAQPAPGPYPDRARPAFAARGDSPVRAPLRLAVRRGERGPETVQPCVGGAQPDAALPVDGDRGELHILARAAQHAAEVPGERALPVQPGAGDVPEGALRVDRAGDPGLLRRLPRVGLDGVRPAPGKHEARMRPRPEACTDLPSRLRGPDRPDSGFHLLPAFAPGADPDD